jgi:hypothetical protein
LLVNNAPIEQQQQPEEHQEGQLNTKPLRCVLFNPASGETRQLSPSPPAMPSHAHSGVCAMLNEKLVFIARTQFETGRHESLNAICGQVGYRPCVFEFDLTLVTWLELPSDQ